MIKTCTIKSSSFAKEWGEGKKHTYYHDLVMDNGDSGQLGAKSKCPEWLEPGQILHYSIEDTQYGSKMKRADPKDVPATVKEHTTKEYTTTDNVKDRSVSLSYAVRLVAASWEGEHAPKRLTSNDLITMADLFYNYMHK